MEVKFSALQCYSLLPSLNWVRMRLNQILKSFSGYSILDVVISVSMYFTLSEIDWLPEIFWDYYITNPKYFEYVNVKAHFRYLGQSEKNVFLQKYIYINIILTLSLSLVLILFPWSTRNTTTWKRALLAATCNGVIWWRERNHKPKPENDWLPGG